MKKNSSLLSLIAVIAIISPLTSFTGWQEVPGIFDSKKSNINFGSLAIYNEETIAALDKAHRSVHTWNIQQKAWIPHPGKLDNISELQYTKNGTLYALQNSTYDKPSTMLIEQNTPALPTSKNHKIIETFIRNYENVVTQLRKNKKLNTEQNIYAWKKDLWSKRNHGLKAVA